ncbi:MAG: hypothetical protein N5824_00585, partial [Lactobacillus iners]|nr:hypothetical protein [Lactobacillus iners]
MTVVTMKQLLEAGVH